MHKLFATEAGDDDDPVTEEEEQLMVAKLRKAGKYSIKASNKSTQCERCIYYLKDPHGSENCHLKTECRVCKRIGNMGGAKPCKKKTGVRKISVEVFTDQSNWHHEKRQPLGDSLKEGQYEKEKQSKSQGRQYRHSSLTAE